MGTVYPQYFSMLFHCLPNNGLFQQCFVGIRLRLYLRVCLSIYPCMYICICVCRLAAYYRNWLWWWYWCSPHRWVGGAKAMPTLALLCTFCIRVPQKREATKSRPSLPSEVTAFVLETIHRSPIMTHLACIVHPILINSVLCTIMHLKLIKSDVLLNGGDTNYLKCVLSPVLFSVV